MGRSLVDAPNPAPGQERVDAHFDARTRFWEEIYGGRDVYSAIHQYRHRLTLRLVDGLGLSAGSKALEVGCGAGLMTVALADHGLRVTATDSSPGMVETARRNVAEAGAGAVEVSVADVHSLPFADASFSLVVALGVIPWLHAPAKALAEMSRVLEPGGHLIVNCDNRWRINFVLDPFTSPLLAPVREFVNRLLRRETGDGLVGMHSQREFDRLVAAAGLERLSAVTLGFGPFTFARRKALPDRVGLAIHHGLQSLCDRGVPGLGAIASQYLVVARKPATPGAGPRA